MKWTYNDQEWQCNRGCTDACVELAQNLFTNALHAWSKWSDHCRIITTSHLRSHSASEEEKKISKVKKDILKQYIILEMEPFWIKYRRMS